MNFPPDADRPTESSVKSGFTLVEILVSLVILSIMSGMLMAAVQGAINSAKIARTRSIISTVESVLRQHYETYKTRPLPVVGPSLGNDSTNSDGNLIVSHEVMPSEAARVRLIMTRDLQRMEIPDKISDLRRPPNTANPNNRINPVSPLRIRAVADQIIEDQTTGQLRLARRNQSTNENDLAKRTPFPVRWYTGGTVQGDWPSRYSSYLSRTSELDRDGNFRWTAKHQGAECLYLILSTTFSAGVAAIESIPESNIGDTDGDGVPEILDGWGRPLGFVRWPVGYNDPLIDRGVYDEFDPFRSDFGHIATTDGDTTPDGLTRPFSIRPLVISAGSDGDFGICFSTRISNFVADDDDLGEPSLVSEEMNYWNQSWPVSNAWMGYEAAGRDRQYLFPDPYLRRFINSRIANQSPYLLPGAALEGSVARGVRADNISNYSLEVTE